MTQTPFSFRMSRPMGVAVLALMALSACNTPLDFDMRGRMGGSVDTSQAALGATAPRPQPDDRGVLSYPTYQVAVARRGDTLASLATRIGTPVEALARFNGIQPQDPLRAGEIIALPTRVAATGTAPLAPAGAIDITTLASNAIDAAPATPPRPRTAPPAADGVEPIRHQVARGETAFTIARLYGVTPRALADWNALDSDYSLREGQYLLIPVALSNNDTQAEPAALPPGTGSVTPVPPSSSQPLPDEAPVAAATPVPQAPAPDIGAQSAPASGAMVFPVQGDIIREYAKGRNDGIDISAPAGTAVKAAASGQVAAITTNTDNVPIVVIKHPDNLLTVYTHLSDLRVEKGDAVSRGQTIGTVLAGDPPRIHFEVRDGFDSVDPMDYLR